MTTVSYDSREEGWDGYEDDANAQLPRRPRRQFFNRRSAALAVVIMSAVGFYAGVHVEKGQLTSTASAGSGSSLPATLRAGAGSGTARRGAGGAGAPTGGFGGANASFGTVNSINGNTIYISDSSGNTVQVKLSAVTKISKSLSVSKKSVRPGDTVVVQGLKNSSGTLIATSVTDSGANASSSTTASSSSGSGTSSGSSAVSSLFGAGAAGGG